MTQPMGMADFFALEAGEYLERLDGLLHGPSTPPVEELVRLARALRGSALMAGQPAIARAAGGLETLARAIREGRVAWDPATRQLATRAVDDLKVFVRRAASWSEADGARADALAAQLEQTSGRTSGPARAVEALGLDAGARAFVAREGAAIASALDRAAQALRTEPRAHEPLQTVLRALQPLRGLAALADLPPLPDLLDGIERAAAECAQAAAPVPDAADLFADAARSISQAAREVAERGRPDPESAAFRRFAERLVRLLEAEAPVVPVETLFHGDAGPHVVQRGTAAGRPANLERFELVSHGEHLRQAADSLERAPSATQRELRAHTLAGTFRSLADSAGGPLADAVSRFAQRARDAVLSGVATRAAAAFAADLRRAGEILSEAAGGDEVKLAARLDTVAAATTNTPSPAPAAPAAPAATARSFAVPESADLAGSWATYERLAAAGVGVASLDDLLGGGRIAVAPATPTVAAPARAPAPTAAAPAAPPARRTESDVVDIRTLLYRGERALARARELREQAKRAPPEHLRELLDEVCDLVALALEPGV
jgi:chemotaxis protein histidine kinase CheA